MPGTTDIAILRIALKEAEDELCQLGHELVNQGWETGTIAKTLDVLRIALYGSDGAGNGLESFDQACSTLRALRAQEEASAG
jgi:hypothetical protein